MNSSLQSARKMFSRVGILFLSLFYVFGYKAAASASPQNERTLKAMKDMSLQGHVISSHDVTSPIDCSFFCSSHDKCKSYNYKPRGAGDSDICQLNNATRRTNSASYKADAGFLHFFDQSEDFTSCLDYLRNGAKENGIYTITDTGREASYPVFCDLTSEPRFAWTLILSFAFKNRNMTEFCNKSMKRSEPVEENHPNWEAYRLSLGRMSRLSQHSTHLRITTGFPMHGVDFVDYLKATLSNVPVLKEVGKDNCRKVKYISIRGHKGTDISVGITQTQKKFFNIDSSRSPCKFDAKADSVSSENNFGYYCMHSNPKFRGSMTVESTTEYWFGAEYREETP